MTYYYQRQCEEPCYSPCNYGTVYRYRSYDCGSPCVSQTLYRDYCPSYSRYYLPYSCRYTQRYSCYPCYPC